ncbi:MAG: hypothetical protein ACP5G7_08505 [Anaerolineae bacterium]
MRRTWQELGWEHLTASQRELIQWEPPGEGVSLWGHGSAATGKSTALVWRLLLMLERGVRADQVLCLVPQRGQAERYQRMMAALMLEAERRGAQLGSMAVDITTYYGLCRRLVALFWPVLAPLAGFSRPKEEPVFLTIEAAEYHMARIVEPLIAEEGYFRELGLPRGRLLSQLLDNLNKSALVGFPPEEIGQRLAQAWVGEADRLLSYQQAQECALAFRRYCLGHNLVDFSLTTALASMGVEQVLEVQDYLQERVTHLLVDNLEENVPVALRLVAWLRERVASTVLLSDEPGGYRLFLGADATMAQEAGAACDDCLCFDEPVTGAKHTLALGVALVRALGAEPPTLRAEKGDATEAILDQTREPYWVTMARWTAARIGGLVAQGTDPARIAVIAPYVSDVMQFVLGEELARMDIPVHLLRPSALLRDDPVIRALLTLTLVAHPQWADELRLGQLAPRVEDVAWAFAGLMEGLDPVRAAYLAQAAWDEPSQRLRAVDLNESDIPRGAERIFERVGYAYRSRYGDLRSYLEVYQQGDPQPVDQFLTELFGQVLSQPGYVFAHNPAAARSLGRLVESAAKFRAATGGHLVFGESSPGASVSALAREYVETVLSGIASADYRADWATEPITGVVLAPAYAYLTRDLHSDYQFWLDLGSVGWWTRPNQPLTHPYVLSAHWPKNAVWTDVHEEAQRQRGLVRVLYGLAARCRVGVYLASSDLGVTGEPAESRLERLLMRVLRPKDNDHDGNA